MDKNNSFRVNLVKRRKELGMTQEQLALRMNVSPQAVSKWENSSYPDGELLPQLAKVLNTSLDELFGTGTGTGVNDIEQSINDEFRNTPPEKRSELFMKMIYTAMCAYNPTTDKVGRLHKSFERETFAAIKTDHEIALARLNPDLRYFMFLENPENGVNSYFGDTKYMVRLLKTLADKDAIRIISYMGSGRRNRMHSVRIISKRLEIPVEKVQQVIDRLDRFGLVWRMAADIGDEPEILYGYTHSQPLTMILTLAKSVTNYLQFQDPMYDDFDRGSFRDETGHNSAEIPQVSWWEDDDL